MDKLGANKISYIRQLRIGYKNMNWGTKIFITLAVFMIGMVAAGVYMVSKDSDSLVDKDYYEQGINFDEVYIRRQNLQTQHAQPAIKINGDTLQIRFKHSGNAGELLLMRASDESQDIKIPFSVSGDFYWTDIQALNAGSWDLQLIWQSGEHAFQYERKIFLD